MRRVRHDETRTQTARGRRCFLRAADIPESVYSMADVMYERIAGPAESEILAIEHFLNTGAGGKSLSN